MKKNNNKLVPFLTKSLKETYFYATQHKLSILGMIKFMIGALRKPFMAAKAAMYRNPATQPVVKQANWMPIVLILIGGIVLIYKDFNFNLNLSAPTSGGGGSGIVNVAPLAINSQPISYDNAGLFTANQDQKNKNYIRQYSNMAVSEMQAYGIPASIKLGAALIESHAGERSSATLFNNHFGLKCYSRQCKKGHCGNLEEMGHKSFYRKYETLQNGWRAHSLMLTTGKFRDLTKSKNYKTWATGLLEKGYYKTQNEVELLIKVIEYYGLQQLDS